MTDIAQGEAEVHREPAVPWEHDAGVWAVVVAGGGGTRFGGLKQFALLAGRPMIEWSVSALACPDRCVVVVPADHVDEVDIAGVRVVAGGQTRSGSVRAGLNALPATADRVLIHDGARPLITREVVGRVIAALDDAEGAVPVVPVTDTLRTTTGEPADRTAFVAVQTPQGFWVESIRQALGNDSEATDDATLVTRSGGRVVHVDGDASNLKVTVADDLAMAESVLQHRESASTGTASMA